MSHVLLSSEPHRAQADLAEDAHFQRPDVNAAVMPDRDPVTFGQRAETKGALIHEPSKRHLLECLSGGPRQAQLEAQSLLHLGDREIEQVAIVRRLAISSGVQPVF